jgi:hypothetical protein
MTVLASRPPIRFPVPDFPSAPAEDIVLTVTVTINSDGGQAADSVASQVGEALRTALANCSGTASDVVVRAPRALIQPVALRIHVPSRTVRWRDVSLSLTRLEFELLLHLARRPGRVCTRRELMAEVWKMPGANRTRTLDVHVRRLRDKTGDRVPLITTVRGVGYVLDGAAGVLIEE